MTRLPLFQKAIGPVIDGQHRLIATLDFTEFERITEELFAAMIRSKSLEAELELARTVYQESGLYLEAARCQRELIRLAQKRQNFSEVIRCRVLVSRKGTCRSRSRNGQAICTYSNILFDSDLSTDRLERVESASANTIAPEQQEGRAMCRFRHAPLRDANRVSRENPSLAYQQN
jgi:hypothetical protein